MVKGRQHHLKTVLTIGASLVIAAFFMWLALRGLSFSEIETAFLDANYFWVFAAFVFGVLGYWFRAVRWKMLLYPLGYRVTNPNSFWSIAFGYLLNLTIPRSGEFARATALYKVEKVPVDQSFGTIILERIVDLFFMLFFLLLTAVTKYEALLGFYRYVKSANQGPADTKDSWLGYILIGATVLVLGASFILLRPKSKIRQKLIRFFKGILEGIKAVQKIENKGKFLLYSAIIWGCYFLAAYLVCFALAGTSDFGVFDGAFILSVGTLGMLVPASGGIGSFHLAMKLGIMALFLSVGKDPQLGAEVGLRYAFLSHTLQLFIMVLFGLISIPVLAQNRKLEQS